MSREGEKYQKYKYATFRKITYSQDRGSYSKIFTRPRELPRNPPQTAVHFSKWEAHFHDQHMQNT